jgi:GT2 family glycosyltransferase/glycosyltransferase involved in cell wall biosynthesis
MTNIGINEVVIFVPIYNAYEDTKACLKSLIENTDHRHKIILLDDSSTDKRIIGLTNLIVSTRENVEVYRNSENLGFVKNCNLGLQRTQDEDVVLLNSDTIVTKNWLEKLIKAAYTKKNIATVTPLTNNGTICSIPNWLESNEISEGFTIESFARLIANTSLISYPEIPTSVGFCMYIKREVINKLGLFDEANFGKGYGEENDFCCRAIKAGYIHILDDTTYIYHAGSKSFQDSKNKLIETNLRILEKLHPGYNQRIQNFINSRSLDNILTNIKLQIYIDKIKKLSPVCYILHNSTEQPLNSTLGGTENHCSALIDNIYKKIPIYTLYFNKHKNTVLFTIFATEKTLRFKYLLSSKVDLSKEYSLVNKEIYSLLIKIFNYFRPALIHIHHLKGWPMISMLEILKVFRTPYIISLHDYFMICPSQKLIDKDSNFCYEHKNSHFCSICVQSIFNESYDFRETWRGICSQLLEGAHLIISPSKSALSYYIREYPTLHEDKRSIIRHGINSTFSKQEKNQIFDLEKNFKYPLKIAFVGAIDRAKGSGTIFDLIKITWNNKEYKNLFDFQIVGETDNHLPRKYKNISLSKRYESHQLKSLLQNVDIAIFPGIWSETYCLTLDEVLSCGIPVITTPIGAIQERVQEFGVGWITQSFSANSILDTLLYVKDNFSEYKIVQKYVRNYPTVSCEEMALKYLDIYNNISREISDNVLDLQILNESSEKFSPSEILSSFIVDDSDPILSPKIPLDEKYLPLRLFKRLFPGFWFKLKTLIKTFLVKN